MAASLPYPALYATHGGIWIAAPDGEVRGIGRGEAIARASESPAIMLNAPLTGQRLGYPDLTGLDLLELFAFAFPARFAVPTPKGLAHALGLEPPTDDGAAAAFLLEAAESMLAHARGRLARARGRLDIGALARTAALDLGAGGGAAPEAARAGRALALLAPARMGGKRRPAAAAPGARRRG